ncbi:thermonuclease family protein [Microvirga sp. 2YAF29]|uniref:thermonuclease family protein n=1 Tax=Microvirga sp. 2YAF29 TaxID=3233031 RepID=UPI003F9E4945
MSEIDSIHDAPHHDGDRSRHWIQMRDRMRALIHAEVAKFNPTDDARRALELIIESSVRPSEVDGELKLTVIDPGGEPRTILRDGQAKPFTLQDLIDELRASHPVLFTTARGEDRIAPRPHPEPAPQQASAPRDWINVGTAASAEKAESFHRKPSLQHWRRHGIRLHAWSRSIRKNLSSKAPEDSAVRLEAVRQSLVQSGERAGAFFEDLRERPVYRRPGFALGTVALAALLSFGAFMLMRDGDTRQADIEEPITTGAVTPSRSVSASANAAATAQASRPSGSRALRGVPDVIDTATLSLEGEVVRLFGVEWAPGAGKPEDLTAYLQGREVSCEPAGSNDTYRCKVGEQDLSRVILYNGGGQPTAEATPELKAASDKAREAKIGVWNSQP